MALPPAFAASALYDRLLHAALKRFFARAVLETESTPSLSSHGRLSMEPTSDPCALSLRWFGSRHTLRVPTGWPFTTHEIRLARAIGQVLAARYQAMFDPKVMADRSDLFQGSINDRYIGAFLDSHGYSIEGQQSWADRIASAIEVLRVAALSSYENRAISSGVLLLAGEAGPGGRGAGPGGIAYSPALTGVKSFYRLCDGVNTVFLANRHGIVVDIVDLGDWVRRSRTGPVEGELPCAVQYRAHAAATRGNQNVCVVLSPSHEIKVFAEGVQMFNFRNADWHLLDLEAKYRRYEVAFANPGLAHRLFQVALDLSEARQGALFVVLHDPAASLPELVAHGDRLDIAMEWPARTDVVSRRDLSYLLTERDVLALDPAVLAAMASMDGAMVMDPDGRLLAAGAILRHPPPTRYQVAAVEGARTTAALAASVHGPVVKVSEDGLITFFDGIKIWDI
ncbi:MAG: hypothetical protein KJ061_00295 [Vicinamibacteraceae bacterium]|nr:hypothetical protein [Vicinamibacteraceae bacterium]